MSPVEEIRRAAQLMRERAQAATEGPWRVGDRHSEKGVVFAIDELIDSVGQSPVENVFVGQVSNRHGQHIPDAAYIASWHPGVALAVADWLDDVAQVLSEEDEGAYINPYELDHADTVARAYLGGTS